MPGGENALHKLRDDHDEIELIMEIFNEWFGDLLIDRQEDLEDCAGYIAEALYLLRTAEEDEVPPFVAQRRIRFDWPSPKVRESDRWPSRVGHLSTPTFSDRDRFGTQG